MTPLRQAFIRELALRGMAPRIQECYIAAVRKLAEHYPLPPDQLSEEQLKEYLLYLSRDKHLAPSSVNQTRSVRCGASTAECCTGIWADCR